MQSLQAFQIKGDLRRLKQVLETGEVMRSDASIHQGPHPAQPPIDAPPPLPATGVRPVAMTSRRDDAAPPAGIVVNSLAGSPSTITTVIAKGRVP